MGSKDIKQTNDGGEMRNRIFKFTTYIQYPCPHERRWGCVEREVEYTLEMPSFYTNIDIIEGVFQAWNTEQPDEPILVFNLNTRKWECKDKRRKVR